MFQGMTDHEKALCIGDALVALRLIVERRGAPIRITEVPVSLASGFWLCEQGLFTFLTVQPRTFRFFLTAKGVKFLREHGIKTDVSLVALRALPSHVSGSLELDHVYIQYRVGSVFEYWDLDALPPPILDTLKMGMLAVHKGLLYGISEAHILGTE